MKDGPVGAAALLLVVLVCGFSLAGQAMGGSPVYAGNDAGECGHSIALKLAPGARLAEKSDGTLVVVRDWSSVAEAEVSVPGLRLQKAGRLDRLGVWVLEPGDSGTTLDRGETDLEAAAGALRLMPGVVWAEVSRPLHACLIPNDPYYAAGSYTPLGQWGPPRVGLPSAWEITTGTEDVVVAVLDSGLDRDAADFSGRIVSPYSVTGESAEWPAWQDNLGHGTAVAGVACARGDDGEGIAGAAWDVMVMPVKISEAGESDTTILSEAIQYAVDQGADVINISFSGPQTSQTLTAAVAYAIAQGVVVVAAAGNDGATTVSYPAASSGVIAVGATTRTDARWSGSNMGAALDLVAPGDDIIGYSQRSSGSFGYWDGTSLSGPLVAGVAALMLSVDDSLTPEQVATIIDETADDLGTPGWDEEFGWGILDAAEAVAQAASAGGTGTTTTTTAASTTTTTTTTPTTEPPTTTTTVFPTTTTIPTTPTTEVRFADVSEATTPYSYAIGYLASLDIVSGSDGVLFHPDDSLKRQQFAKIIVRACGYAVSGSEVCPFRDVAKQMGTDPYYPYCYVAVAYAQGVTKGTDDTHFSPLRTLTRAQMITMVARAAGLAEPPEAYEPPFARFAGVHYGPARAAAYAGLLDGLVGIGPGYDLGAPATRGEVCAVIYELLQ